MRYDFSVRELKALVKLMLPDERVLSSAKKSRLHGSLLSRIVFITTNRRIVALSRKVLRSRSEIAAIPYENIASFRVAHGLMTSSVQIRLREIQEYDSCFRAKGNEREITGLSKDDAESIAYSINMVMTAAIAGGVKTTPVPGRAGKMAKAPYASYASQGYGGDFTKEFLKAARQENSESAGSVGMIGEAVVAIHTPKKKQTEEEQKSLRHAVIRSSKGLGLASLAPAEEAISIIGQTSTGTILSHAHAFGTGEIAMNTESVYGTSQNVQTASRVLGDVKKKVNPYDLLIFSERVKRGEMV